MTAGRLIGLAFFALSLAGFCVGAAQAETRIAIVDLKTLLSESDAAKSIQSQIQSHREEFMTDLSVREQALREEEKTLSEESSTLPAEIFAQKRKDFERRFFEAREQAQNRKGALDQAALEATNTLKEEIYKVIEALAAEKYDVVLLRQAIILAQKSMDITDEAMKMLNENISSIDLKVEDKKL